MADTAKKPRYGDVWWADLDPVRGHEQGRRRPCVVVSVNEFNQIRHGLVWIVPVTGSPRAHSFTVEVPPSAIPSGDTGLPKPSMALCHQLRTISVDRLLTRSGTVSEPTLTEIQARVRLILGM